MFYCMLSFIVPFICVFLLGRALVFKGKNGSLCLTNICISSGFGLGLSSFSFFILACVMRISIKALLAIEASLLMFSVLICWLHTNKKKLGMKHPKTEIFNPLRCFNGDRHSFLQIVFYICLISAAVAFIFEFWANPHGRWDAWSMWNTKARYLFLGGEHWDSVFSEHNRHPDYPLLIPSLVARSWKFYGHNTQLLPATIAIAFTFATVMLLYSSLSVLKSRTQGILGGVVLLGTPFFIVDGAGLCADVPLAFFILCVCVLFCLSARFSDNYGYYILAGIAMGCAAWTKNEGLLFIALTLLCHLVITVGKNGFRAYLREIAYLGAGFVPLFVIVVVVKLKYSSPNDLISAQNMSFLFSTITDSSRYFFIAATFYSRMMYLGKIFFPVPIILILYLLFIGTDIKREYREKLILLITILFLMLCGYALIYLGTPYDLEFHLRTSLDRLLIHVWPSLIFCYFIFVAAPEEVSHDYQRY